MRIAAAHLGLGREIGQRRGVVIGARQHVAVAGFDGREVALETVRNRPARGGP